MYAIVDIETTGGYASANGITEIAIILHNGREVEGRYHTLVNPNQVIPRYITVLTGITNEMVKEAPAFEEVAENIFNLLHDRVFVAHNVNFDFSFLHHHLAALGLELQNRKLCTVRLGRKIIPGLPSYSLGNFCRSLSIVIENRHRAMGDAMATAMLFERLLEKDTEGHVEKMLRRGSRENYLPMHLPAEHLSRLPYTPGVYYFHDEKDKVVYVGKARNLRYRVTSHFSNNTPSKRKQELIRNVHKITYLECGTEFMAGVMESLEIKRLWPPFNFSQKKLEFAYGLFEYEDRLGFLRLGIERKRKNLQTLYSFPFLTEGYTLLWDLVKRFGLCPRLCYLQQDETDCVGMEEGYCQGACMQKEDPAGYNARVKEAIASLMEYKPTFAVVDDGRNNDERSCILVEEGRFYGLGYIPAGLGGQPIEELKSYLTPYPENSFVRSMVFRYMEANPEKLITW